MQRVVHAQDVPPNIDVALYYFSDEFHVGAVGVRGVGGGVNLVFISSDFCSHWLVRLGRST